MTIVHCAHPTHRTLAVNRWQSIYLDEFQPLTPEVELSGVDACDTR